MNWEVYRLTECAEPVSSLILFPGRHLGAEFDAVTSACRWVVFPVALINGNVESFNLYHTHETEYTGVCVCLCYWTTVRVTTNPTARGTLLKWWLAYCFGAVRTGGGGNHRARSAGCASFFLCWKYIWMIRLWSIADMISWLTVGL